MIRAKLATLGFAVWLWLTSSCMGLRYVVEREILQVISSNGLKGAYEASIGPLGQPQQGGPLVGKMVYPKANQKACQNPPEYFNISCISKPGDDLPIILLVGRGDCKFTLKVYHAELAGSMGALITDNRDEPSIDMDNPYEVPKEEDKFWVGKINIPSALTSKSLGESIKESLSRGELVSINLTFNSTVNRVALANHEKVKYEVWISGNLGCGAKCEDHIGKMLEEKGYTHFILHSVTWYCPQAFIFSRLCKSQCIFRGR